MIIGKDIHPERKVYYWGALIIETLNSWDEPGADYFSIFEAMRAKYDISVEVFTLALDWLFIIDAIENKKGFIKKCF